MFAAFKKFDVHVKTVDGVNQQTVLGAVLTLLSTVLVMILILSEVANFSKVDVVSRMLADQTAGVASVKLEFDLSFKNVPCDRIEFTQEVTRGTVHIHEPGIVETFALDDGLTIGCHVRGSSIIDKVGGNFKFETKKKEISDPIFDMSHTIHRIAFLPTQGPSAEHKIKDVSHSLQDQEAVAPQGTALWHYGVQVVPTQYKTLYGELSSLNQYSVLEKVVSAEQMQTHEPVSGLHLREFSGIVFTYDFHPVMLFMEERREKIIDFISNLCGIVGGVITILSLFEGLLHQSAKVMIGKKD